MLLLAIFANQILNKNYNPYPNYEFSHLARTYELKEGCPFEAASSFSDIGFPKKIFY